MVTHSSFLPGESHGQKSLVIYSPKGCKESDTTEQLKHTHTHTHRDENKQKSIMQSSYLTDDKMEKYLNMTKDINLKIISFVSQIGKIMLAIISYIKQD